MLSVPLLSTLAIVIFAVLIVIVERVRPQDQGQKLFRKGFWADFAFYSIIQSALLGALITTIVLAVNAWTGASQAGWVSDWPFWIQLLFFVVTHDFYIYCFHRLQHKSKVLWRTHEAHHSVEDVDWVAGSRSHALEIFINQTIEFAPMILLGANPIMPAVKGAVSAIWGIFIHANIDVRLGPLSYIINGPEMHRWHHAKDIPRVGVNFATKFAFWDYLFGTAYRPGHNPQGYGLFESDDPFPDNVVTQFTHAFRPFTSSPTIPDPVEPQPPAVSTSPSRG